MEFPFDFKVLGTGITYTATIVGGKLKVTWPDEQVGSGEATADDFSVNQADTYVRDGTWVIVEPELKFPIVVKSGRDYEYTLTKGTSGVDVWSHRYKVAYPNHVSLHKAKEFIDNGTWIVQEPVEALVVESSKLTITVGSQVALEAVKELTEAVNNLTDAYERMLSVQIRFKESFNV